MSNTQSASVCITLIIARLQRLNVSWSHFKVLAAIDSVGGEGVRVELEAALGVTVGDGVSSAIEKDGLIYRTTQKGTKGGRLVYYLTDEGREILSRVLTGKSLKGGSNE